MAISTIKETIDFDINKVWDTVYNISQYEVWRSDLSRIEIIDKKKFIEYAKNGYPTTFTVTAVNPYKCWEFDMDNSNISGHWIGNFYATENKTVIEFTEEVMPKKWFLKPFIKSYLQKQQTQFITDLKSILS